MGQQESFAAKRRRLAGNTSAAQPILDFLPDVEMNVEGLTRDLTPPFAGNVKSMLDALLNAFQSRPGQEGGRSSDVELKAPVTPQEPELDTAGRPGAAMPRRETDIALPSGTGTGDTGPLIFEPSVGKYIPMKDATDVMRQNDVMEGPPSGAGVELQHQPFSLLPDVTGQEDSAAPSPDFDVSEMLPVLAGFAQMIPQGQGASALMKMLPYMLPGIGEAGRQVIAGEEIDPAKMGGQAALNMIPKVLASALKLPAAAARNTLIKPAIAAGGKFARKGSPTVTGTARATNSPPLTAEQGTRLLELVRKHGFTLSRPSLDKIVQRSVVLENEIQQLTPAQLRTAAGKKLTQELADTELLFTLLSQSKNQGAFAGSRTARMLAGAGVGNVIGGIGTAMGVNPAMAFGVGNAIGIPAGLAASSPGLALSVAKGAEQIGKFGAPVAEGVMRTGMAAAAGEGRFKSRRRGSQ